MTSLLNKKCLKLNDKLTVVIPTLKDIKGSDLENGVNENENNYYSIMNLFFSNTTACIASLHQLGIDYTTISDYELFLILYNVSDKEVMRKVSPLMFKEFNFADFEICQKKNSNKPVLYNEIADFEIDEYIYNWLSTVFCTMHLFSKTHPLKPANETAKKFIIERALKKMNKKQKNQDSAIDSLILAIVNNSNFKYDFKSVYDLSIYDFNASVRQIVKKYQVDNLYHGMYAGTIDGTKINEKKLNWLSIDFELISKKKEIMKV